MSVTLEELVALRNKLVSELRHVNARIDEYKVKCPTCRCRILPATVCACCAVGALDELDEPF